MIGPWLRHQTSVRPDVGFEYATVLGVAGRYDRMVAVVDEVGLKDAPEQVLQAYCESLTHPRPMGQGGTGCGTPWGTTDAEYQGWLLHLRAVVAIRSDDFPKAIEILRGPENALDGRETKRC